MNLPMPLPRFLSHLSLGVALLAATAACRKPSSKPDPRKGLTATTLLQMGEAEVKVGRMDDGRRYLRTIEEQLPFTPEYPRAKVLLADSYFFAASPSYPEALVEYQSFLNIFPRHELRDYALYRVALCHYASIETAERDQAETRTAFEGFQHLLRESPGSVYTSESKAKIVQCWRRLAEHELVVGIFYVNTFHFAGAEKRLKELLETYPEYVDRERAYFYLGEAMRQRLLVDEDLTQFNKDYAAKLGKEDLKDLTREQVGQYGKDFRAFSEAQIKGYRAEAKSYYQKLVESYPGSEWARRAADRLITMGTSGVKEELDS